MAGIGRLALGRNSTPLSRSVPLGIATTSPSSGDVCCAGRASTVVIDRLANATAMNRSRVIDDQLTPEAVLGSRPWMCAAQAIQAISRAV
jgi:hypothetical protein